MRRLMLWGLLALLGCGDDPNDWEPGRPRVARLRLLQQSPQDPLALEVQVAFEDTDGDLAQGVLELRINGDKNATLPMADVFEQQSPPLAPDATEGQIDIIVRLIDEVAVGDRVKIGVVLEDGAGRRSNEPYFEIEAF
ncbi:MAG: hypothetical protein RMA76_10880 [Deltaproteobacteria bacterium]